MENWKVNLNSVTSNNNYLYEQNDINKALAPNSVFDTQGVQNINSISAESNILNDIEIEDNSIETNSSTETVNTDELIIKQLEAKIEELKSEYEAKQEGKGVAGAVGGFFASCWNGIRGKGFKNNAKVELDEKINLLEEAKADPSKLAEAYKEIMGTELTDEIRNSSVESQNVANGLSKEEKEQIISLLKEQAASLSQAMKETKDDQGWFSKAMGGINNVLGLGTNSRTADAKIEHFIEQVNSLSADDPDFAAKYQAITGEALSLEGINELYQGASKVGDSYAAEAIMDYEETQAAAKEIGCGIVTGLVVAGGVIAAPFTGGASLAATAAFGAAVGGTTTVLIKGTDTIGTSKKYSFEQAVLDFGSGAITGATTAVTLGGAGLAGKGFSALKGAGTAGAKEAARQAVSGGLKNTAKNAFTGIGKTALRGAKIAAASSASSYMLNTVGKNALYEATGNYTKSEEPANIVQNEDGTYSVYYALTDSNTGDVISYEIEKVDSLSKDENGNLIKGNVLETSRTTDFNFKDLVKQTTISAGTAAIGAGIGRFTGNLINPYATSLTNSVAVGHTAEIVSDATLSLGADYLIASAQAGEFVDASEFFSWDRILGEGRNQIRGLLIGLASSKINSIDTATIDVTRSSIVDVKDIPVKTDDGDSVIKTDTDVIIKFDGTSVPKTQQDVLETAGKLIIEDDNATKATELLKAYGMDDSEVSAFIKEATDVKQEMDENPIDLDVDEDGTATRGRKFNHDIIDRDYAQEIRSKNNGRITENDLINAPGRSKPIAEQFTDKSKESLETLRANDPKKYELVTKVLENTKLHTKTSKGVSDKYVESIVEELTKLDPVLLRNIIDNDISIEIYDDMALYNGPRYTASYSQVNGQNVRKQLTFYESKNGRPIYVNGVKVDATKSMAHEAGHAFDYNNSKKLDLTRQEVITRTKEENFDRFAEMASFSKEFDDAITADIIRMSEADVLAGREYGQTFGELLEDPDFKYYLGVTNKTGPFDFNDVSARKELYAQMVSYVTSGKVSNPEFQKRIEELFPNMLEFTRKTVSADTSAMQTSAISTKDVYTETPIKIVDGDGVVINSEEEAIEHAQNLIIDGDKTKAIELLREYNLSDPEISRVISEAEKINQAKSEDQPSSTGRYGVQSWEENTDKGVKYVTQNGTRYEIKYQATIEISEKDTEDAVRHVFYGDETKPITAGNIEGLHGSKLKIMWDEINKSGKYTKDGDVYSATKVEINGETYMEVKARGKYIYLKKTDSDNDKITNFTQYKKDESGRLISCGIKSTVSDDDLKKAIEEMHNKEGVKQIKYDLKGKPVGFIFESEGVLYFATYGGKKNGGKLKSIYPVDRAFIEHRGFDYNKLKEVQTNQNCV